MVEEILRNGCIKKSFPFFSQFPFIFLTTFCVLSLLLPFGTELNIFTTHKNDVFISFLPTKRKKRKGWKTIKKIPIKSHFC